jgi:hypothetical protein
MRQFFIDQCKHLATVFQVLTVVLLNIRGFWGATLCPFTNGLLCHNVRIFFVNYQLVFNSSVLQSMSLKELHST